MRTTKTMMIFSGFIIGGLSSVHAHDDDDDDNDIDDYDDLEDHDEDGNALVSA